MWNPDDDERLAKAFAWLMWIGLVVYTFVAWRIATR